NAEADIANGEDGKGVGDGPEAACEDAPDDQVRRLPNVGAHLTGAADECGEAPAREEYADNHQKRNNKRRYPDLDQLGGSFGGAEPGACAEATEDADELKLAETRRLNGWRHRVWGGRVHKRTQRIQWSTRSPPSKMMAGTQK